MQFQVPQFIEVEDKIFGPLSFKQFLYLAGGGGLSFIIYQSLPLFFAILLIAPVLAFSVALAFYKMNSKPFIEIVESALKYVSGGKLYIWKKSPKKKGEPHQVVATEVEGLRVPRLSDSKLKDIAWSLGVKESVYADQVEDKSN